MSKQTLSKKKELEAQYATAMKNVKKLSIVCCSVIVILVMIGAFITPKKSYALLSTDPLPETFTSNADAAFLSEIGTITIPAGFTGTHSGGSLTDIYCLEHRLGIQSGITYTKAGSVLSQYPGLVYILDNNDTRFSTGNSKLNHYLTQIVIWWYLDLVNGYDNDKNYIGPTEVWSGQEVSEEDKYEDKEYRFYNNLSVLDKIAINENATFGPTIISFVEEALAYTVPVSTTLNVTSANSITYQVVNGYLETSDISVTSDSSDFVSYTITPDEDSKIEVLDNTGSVTKGNFSAKETFKLRIPMTEMKDNHLSLNVNITGKFRHLNAYYYNPSDIDMQRVVLGQAIEEPLNDKLELNYDIELGKVIIHKQEASTNQELAGATLVITDSQGRQVTKFVTGDEPKEISLPIGAYTVTETIIPEGYGAEVTSYDFTVSKDTTIEVVLKNTKEIPVPDTAMDAAAIYGIGISIVIVGIILIIVAIKPEKKKNDTK